MIFLKCWVRTQSTMLHYPLMRELWGPKNGLGFMKSETELSPSLGWTLMPSLTPWTWWLRSLIKFYSWRSNSLSSNLRQVHTHHWSNPLKKLATYVLTLAITWMIAPPQLNSHLSFRSKYRLPKESPTQVLTHILTLIIQDRNNTQLFHGRVNPAKSLLLIPLSMLLNHL